MMNNNLRKVINLQALRMGGESIEIYECYSAANIKLLAKYIEKLFEVQFY